MRILTALTAIALLLGTAACGDNDADDASSRTTARPTATSQIPGDAGSDGDGEGSALEDSSGSGGSATPGGAATPTPAPLPPAPAGKANRPRAGDYVYDVSGRSTDPFNPQGRDFPPGAQETVSVSVEGDTYTLRTTSNQPGSASTTTRTRWGAETVQLLSMRIDVAGQSYECAFDPALTVLRFPLKAETYPTQTGRGQDCEATTQIQVVGQEDTTTPAGPWKAWRLQTSTEYRFRSELSGTVSGVSWFSPGLGFEVRGERENSGTYQTQSFASTVNTALRSHP